MPEKNGFDPGLVKIGELLINKRKNLSPDYRTREGFIDHRSAELFNYEPWISLRHLTNLELGKNWPSIEKLLILATALEEDPVDLFQEIIQAYRSTT